MYDILIVYDLQQFKQVQLTLVLVIYFTWTDKNMFHISNMSYYWKIVCHLNLKTTTEKPQTRKVVKAAFSKSVSCTSIGLNSTRQPILVFGGGGLKRIVCQLVDWMFCGDKRNG